MQIFLSILHLISFRCLIFVDHRYEQKFCFRTDIIIFQIFFISNFHAKKIFTRIIFFFLKEKMKTLSILTRCIFQMLHIFYCISALIYRIVHAVPCRTSFTNIGVPFENENEGKIKSIN